MSFNPISKSSWLYDFCEVNPPSSFLYTHSSYKDNPFLPQAYRDAIDEMETRNPDKYRIYGRGEWGVDAEGLVIRNWHVEDFDAMELASRGLERRSGMDIGWIDKSAIIDTLYDRTNRTIYVFNEFYKSGCQLSELADAIRNMNLTKTKLFVDSAEARSIAYFKQEGIRAVPCAKGAGSVKSGIMFLQDHLIIVHPSCVNLINELENFSYIKSKITGNWTEEMTHEYSHAIDGLRYGYSDIYTQSKAKVFDKSILGL
jgi:phage terminase large subunit